MKFSPCLSCTHIPHVYSFGLKSVTSVLKLSSERTVYFMDMMRSSSTLRPHGQSLQEVLGGSQQLSNGLFDFASLWKTWDCQLSIEQYYRMLVDSGGRKWYLIPGLANSSLSVRIELLWPIGVEAIVYGCWRAHVGELADRRTVLPWDVYPPLFESRWVFRLRHFEFGRTSHMSTDILCVPLRKLLIAKVRDQIFILKRN